MNVLLEMRTPPIDVVRAAHATLARPPKNKTVKDLHAFLRRMYMSKHSPIRTHWFWLELIDINYFAATHYLRHELGIHPTDMEPFYRTGRKDRGGADRMTLTSGLFQINAAALMGIAEQRLCYNADNKAIAICRLIKKRVKELDEDLAICMVPKCVARNGLCTEPTMCKPGLEAVCNMYSDYFDLIPPGHKLY